MGDLVEIGRGMEIGTKIRQLRKARAWSQAELAERLAIHMNHVSKLETGKFTPSIDLLKKMTEVFEVSADFLISDEDAADVTRIDLHNRSLMEKLKFIQELEEADQQAILNVLETYITKKKMRDLLGRAAVTG